HVHRALAAALNSAAVQDDVLTQRVDGLGPVVAHTQGNRLARADPTKRRGLVRTVRVATADPALGQQVAAKVAHAHGERRAGSPARPDRQAHGVCGSLDVDRRLTDHGAGAEYRGGPPGERPNPEGDAPLVLARAPEDDREPGEGREREDEHRAPRQSSAPWSRRARRAEESTAPPGGAPQRAPAIGAEATTPCP